MSDSSQGPGWWLASDGNWYPPLDAAPAPGWWLASDGQWYPPSQRSAADTTSEPAPEPEPAAAVAAPAKPPAAKPVAAKPVKPVAAKPAAKPVKPTAAKPAAAKPVAAKPVAAKPVAAKPAEPRVSSVPDATHAESPASTAKPAFRRTPADPDQQIRKQNEQSRQTNAAMAAARAAAATRALKHLESQIQNDLEAAPAPPPSAARSAHPVASEPVPAMASPPATSPSAPTHDADEPLLEVKGSALASDIENIGERLALFDDRVELRDRTGKAKQIIYGADIADVVVHKKLAGCTVTIESGAGTTITAKGLKPEQAEEIRAIVLKHTRQAPRPEGVPAPILPMATDPIPTAPVLGASHPKVSPLDEVVLLQKLEDLHRAGILSDDELADKRKLLAALARGEATVSTSA